MGWKGIALKAGLHLTNPELGGLDHRVLPCASGYAPAQINALRLVIGGRFVAPHAFARLIFLIVFRTASQPKSKTTATLTSQDKYGMMTKY